MLCAIEYIKIVQDMTSETAFGQHAFNCVTDDLVCTVLALAQLGRSVETLSARITSITGVHLVGFFLASEYHLSGIDDDNIVTTVYVRSEVRFVLSTQNLGNLRAKTANYLVCGVDNNPLFLCCFLICGNSFVT